MGGVPPMDNHALSAPLAPFAGALVTHPGSSSRPDRRYSFRLSQTGYGRDRRQGFSTARDRR
jgi:hypothetical protein